MLRWVPVLLALAAAPVAADPGRRRGGDPRSGSPTGRSAFNARDTAGACGLFAPDLRYTRAGHHRRHPGDACAPTSSGSSTATTSACATRAPEIHEITVSGDIAVVRLTWTLDDRGERRHRDDDRGRDRHLPPPGRRALVHRPLHRLRPRRPTASPRRRRQPADHNRDATRMDPRRLEMTVLMTPDMANFSGKVHGGALLNLLDRVAFSCASRYSGRYAVTLSVDQVTFKEPIHVGELVTFRAAVNHAGRTSMEIGIRVEAENIRAGTRPPHQLLLLHHGRRRRRRPPRRGAGAPRRDPRRGAPQPRRRAPPQAPPRDRRRARRSPRRERHEHLVLGRHRPRHRPRRPSSTPTPRSSAT